MGLPKRLTDMQKRFVEFLVFGGPDGPVSKTEAALLAGYSPKRAMVEGSELTNPRQNPLVVAYKAKLTEDRLQKHHVTYDKHLAELDRIKGLALKKNSFSAAGNMEVARGKAAGLYVDKKEVRTGKLEEMTEEQLRAKRQQLLSDYAPLLGIKSVEGVVEETTKSSESSEQPKLVSSSDPQKSDRPRPDQKTQTV
jgi:phage terminase small subunit|tara:strand:+ start:30 stop:614 length:585 start_codon:yes stop_codon:yes gene_type:complete